MTDMTDILTSSSDPAQGAAENKVSVITVNFKDGDVVDRVQHEGESAIPRLLRDLARRAQKEKVKSVIVLTITEDDHVDWLHVAENEHHLALAALCLDDIKDDLKNHIFMDMEEEEA